MGSWWAWWGLAVVVASVARGDELDGAFGGLAEERRTMTGGGGREGGGSGPGGKGGVEAAGAGSGGVTEAPLKPVVSVTEPPLKPVVDSRCAFVFSALLSNSVVISIPAETPLKPVVDSSVGGRVPTEAPPRPPFDSSYAPYFGLPQAADPANTWLWSATASPSDRVRLLVSAIENMPKNEQGLVPHAAVMTLLKSGLSSGGNELFTASHLATGVRPLPRAPPRKRRVVGNKGSSTTPPPVWTYPLVGPRIQLPPLVAGELNRYNSREAYQFLHDNPDAVFIDVRQEVEHYYVGHPIGAELIAWTEYPQDNATAASTQNFVLTVGDRVKNNVNTKLVMICRSGKRTIEAANALLDAGYKMLVHVHDGFEGDLDANNHRGTLGGWRYAGMPWEQE